MMKLQSGWAETLILAVAAAAFIAISGLGLDLELLNRARPSIPWEAWSSTIRLVLMAYGVLLAILASASLATIRYRNRTLWSQCGEFLHSAWSEFVGTVRWVSGSVGSCRVALWMVVFAAVGLTMRGCFLAQPMRYDESFTVMKFLNAGFFHLFYYPLPNNHVLYTLLARVSMAVFGNHPVAIRLPAFLIGVCVIPTTFCFCRLLLGERGGYLAAALAAVFPYLVLYDTMARGYSLAVLLGLWVAILGLRFASNPSFASCFLISLLAALGILTMPLFVLALAGLYLWITTLLLIKEKRVGPVLRSFVVPCGALTVVLTGIVYTPTILVSKGVDTILHNRFVAGMLWSDFLSRLLIHPWNTFNQFRRDVPIALVLFVVLFMFVGIVFWARRKRWEIALLLPALAVGGWAVLFVKHVMPYAKGWTYMLPFIFVGADAGFVYASNRLRPWVFSNLRFVFLILACLWGASLMSRNAILSYWDTGLFPEAAPVVDVLSREMRRGDEVVVTCPASSQVRYYMWYKGVPNRDRFSESDPRKEFYVVKKSWYSLRDLTEHDARMLMELGDAELYVRDLPGE